MRGDIDDRAKNRFKNKIFTEMEVSSIIIEHGMETIVRSSDI